MKKKIFAVALATTMAVSSAMTAFAAEYSLAANSANEFANPLKGTNPKEVTLEFNMTLADDAAANGWDSVVSIYNSETNGRLSFQTNPYVCYNSDGNGGNTSFFDYNQPGDGSTAKIGDLKDGKAHAYSYKITADGITMAIDGETIATDKKGGEATFQEAIDFVNAADKLYIGVGDTDSRGEGKISFWFTEKCTLSDVKVNGTEVGTTPADDPTKATDPTKADDPTQAPAATTTKAPAAAKTGDVAPVAALAAVAVVACAAVVVSKKKVTE